MSDAAPTPGPTFDLLEEAVGLKELPRTGWVRRGVPGPESVAAHSWGVAWLVLALLPAELDRARALSYAVLHDLPEVRIGDLTPHDGVDKARKAALEAEALDDLLAGAGGRGAELIGLWHDYEAQLDEEARFVRQCDRLDMAVQAVAYARSAGGPPAEELVEFVDSAARVIEHPALRPLVDACYAALGQTPSHTTASPATSKA